jgi:MFS family permease
LPARQRLDWLGSAARVVLVARGLRAFATGVLSVAIALFLGERGLDLPEIGIVLSAGVLGGAGWAALLNASVARLGRRTTLVATTFCSAAAAAGLLVDGGLAWLAGCAAVGALAGIGGAGGAGPAQPLEQAILADACPTGRQPALFAGYRLISTLATAAGGLAAGLPAWLGAPTAGLAWLVAGFSLCLVIVGLAYLVLPETIETERGGPRWSSPLHTPSRRLILRLNALFAVDQLGSSLTTASLVTYWFHTRFGIELGGLAGLAFATQMLAAGSMWLSVRLSARIGLVRTMVFTHLPASLLLVALAFVPSAQWAVAIWLARGLLSQMDIPARDALTMAVVAPEERIAMASLHLVGRNGVGTLGPTLATTLWSWVSAAAPIALAGVLKTGYDLALYAAYRNLEPGRVELGGRSAARGSPLSGPVAGRDRTSTHDPERSHEEDTRP